MRTFLRGLAFAFAAATGATATAGNFVNDTFTGTTGTILSSHTGELGATWTALAGLTGGDKLDGNALRHSDGYPGWYVASGTPATNGSFDVQTEVKLVGTLPSDQVGLIANATTGASTNMYVAMYDSVSATKGWVLRKYVNGVSSDTSASATLTAGTIYTLKLEIRPGSQRLLVNGVEKVKTTDTSVGTPFKAGVFMMGSGSSTTNGLFLDNFAALNPTGSAPVSDNTPPTPAPTLSASGASTTSIQLSWTASQDLVGSNGATPSGLAGYNVYRAIGTATRQLVNSAILTGLSYTDTGLVSGTSYTYTVEAKDVTGNVATSNLVMVSPLAAAVDNTPPTVPANVTATSMSRTSVQLRWDPSNDPVGSNGVTPSGVASYNVYRNGVRINVSPITGTTYTDATLVSGTVYSYTVQAVDAKNNSSQVSASVASDESLDLAAKVAAIKAATPAKYHLVTNLSDFATFAAGAAQPGDVVVLQDNGLGATSTTTNTTVTAGPGYDFRSGPGTIRITTSNVIYTAATPCKNLTTATPTCGVRFYDSAPSSSGGNNVFLRIEGAGNTIGGFQFDGMDEPLWITSLNNNKTATIGAVGNRVTGNVIQRGGQVSKYGMIEVRYRSNDNRFDNNRFDTNWAPLRITLDDGTSDKNNCGASSNPSVTMGPSHNLRLDHNTFIHTATLDPGGAVISSVFNTGPGPDISTGDCTPALHTDARFEFNTLDSVMDGSQIIQNKTTGNVFGYNTFRNVLGSLTLRAGDNVNVYGNYFVYTGAQPAAKDVTGPAIIMNGANHNIYNNIFDLLNSSCAICVSMWGNGSDGSTYSSTTNNLIANNTIINVAPMDGNNNFGWGIAVGKRGTTGVNNAPTNTTVVNNIVMSSATGTTFEGGLLYLAQAAQSVGTNMFKYNMLYKTNTSMRYYSDVDSNTGATGAFNWNDTVGSATNSYAQGNFLGNSGITSTT